MQAIAARDSLAKALYGSLFDWIVDQVNVSLAASSAAYAHKVTWECRNLHMYIYSSMTRTITRMYVYMCVYICTCTYGVHAGVAHAEVYMYTL